MNVAVNAALALTALAFLTLVAFVAAGRGSSASAAPHRTTLPTFSSTTSPPTTAPPTTPPRSPASTVPPATAPPSRTPRTTVPLRRGTTRTPGASNLTPLLPASTIATTTTSTTTIAAIGGRLPPAPVTLPLTTKSSNAHVDPLFAWLSGIGFLVAILIMAGRFIFQ